MGNWPRFKITPDEAKYSAKYEDPRKAQRGVLRRMYTNALNISNSRRIDSAQFQISRRCRVFGLTAAGDIDHMLLELVDSTGEQYTATPVHICNLLKGWNPDPLSEDGMQYDGTVPNLIASVRDDGPFIQEPNIVLAPNQSLNLTVTPADQGDLVTSLRVELTLHVYEFPGMPGSPL